MYCLYTEFILTQISLYLTTLDPAYSRASFLGILAVSPLYTSETTIDFSPFRSHVHIHVAKNDSRRKQTFQGP